MVRKLKWVLLSLSLIVLVAIGYYTYAFLNFAKNIQEDPATKIGSIRPSQLSSKNGESLLPPKWEGKDRVNVLILGGDSRGLKKNEVPRSDSIMVASIDPATKKAYLFSILRDTYVKIPDHGEDRINVAYALGGANLAMKTVSDLLGIPIQYYVYTDFKGFVALVDAIGGIEIDVEKDMKYKDAYDGPEYDIDLKKGLQTLDGKKALQYVRFRHDALSDFSRTERQRKFLQAVAAKMQSTGSLIRLPKILNSIDPYIETNLSTMDMLKLGTLGYEAKTEGMVSQQVPPQELLVEKRVGGAEVLGVDQNRLKIYVKALFEGKDPIMAIHEKPATTTNVKSSPSLGTVSGAGSTKAGSSTSTGSTSVKGTTANPTAGNGSTSTANAVPKPGTSTTGTGTSVTGTAGGGTSTGTKPSTTTGTKTGTESNTGGTAVTSPDDTKAVPTPTPTRTETTNTGTTSPSTKTGTGGTTDASGSNTDEPATPGAPVPRKTVQ